MEHLLLGRDEIGAGRAVVFILCLCFCCSLSEYSVRCRTEAWLLFANAFFLVRSHANKGGTHPPPHSSKDGVAATPGDFTHISL